MEARGDATKSLVGFRESLDTAKSDMENITTDLLKAIMYGPTGQAFFEKAGDVLSGMTGKAESISGNFWSDVVTQGGFGKALKVKVVDWYDSVAGTVGNVKENITKRRDEGESWWDIGTPWDTKAEKEKKGTKLYSGTVGAYGKLFANFGTGTPTVLHGEEAVVPKASLFGSILDSFNQKLSGGTTTTDTTQIASAPVTSDAQLLTLNNTAKQIASSSQKLELYLNTLVTVSSMTEKNTKSTHKGLAELRGSLV
jgi:hypothetical protein